MNVADCPRRWEAEALEDGRLDGADRASFERHLATCAACPRELAALEALRRAMHALPEPSSTPIEHHRLRAALLREANARVVSTRRGPSPRALIGIAATLVAIGIAATLIRIRTNPPVVTPANASSSAPTFDVDAVGDAVWRSRTDGATTSIDLTDGIAEFSVPHLEPTQRFLVALPDGEVEVRGTRFVVAVKSGATTSVAVTEGRVAFRRVGEAEILLRAGERWSTIASTIASTTATKIGDAPSSESLATPTPPPSASSRRPHASVGASAIPSATPTAGARFGDAMSSFQAADYARADSQLAQFALDFPADPRCEDAAFLRAVAHVRMGDRAGASTLARAYVRAYPSGLRRVEAQHILEGATVHP